MDGKRIKPCLACAMVMAALFAVQLVMHMNCDNLLLDDWTFYSVLEAGDSVPAWLARRWHGWSSRLLIEGALCWITHSIWAFRLLDSMAMVALAWGLARLAGGERRPDVLSLAALLVTSIPFAVLRSTGWMATSLNYYWPLAATSIALIPLADGLWGRRTGRPLTAAAVLCAVFAANQEQTSAVLVGSYLAFGAWLAIRERRMRRSHVLILAVALAELIAHLTCPGNAERARLSVGIVNLRDYGQFTLVDKLSIGLTSTATLLLFTYCPVLLACGAVTASTVTARRRGVLAYALLLPVVGLAFLGWGARVASRINGVSAWMELLRYDDFNDYVLQLGPERIGPMSLIAFFRIIVVLGLMALALYLSIGHRPMAAASVFVFAIGFAARMALSLSPTVVESGERTMLPLYGAMMLCALLCARDCTRECARRWPLALAFVLCALVAGANVLGSFALAA